MWRDYSAGYIRNNRSSSMSIMIAAFICAVFLSLMMGLFYNMWKADVERIIRSEGDWQGRLTGPIDEEAIARIQQYANVSRVVVLGQLENSEEVTVDVYFENMGTILRDMPKIAQIAGLESNHIFYHHALLSQYLVRDPQDPQPRLILPFYLGIMALACISLILLIHNAFAVTMNARTHQFGILSSVGATPKQIRSGLLQEAFGLCALPVLLGNILGIGASVLVVIWTNTVAVDAPGRFEIVWGYHPLLLLVTLAITFVTILISAWIPAGKLSRMTPLEAIRNSGESGMKHGKTYGVRRSRKDNRQRGKQDSEKQGFLTFLFGFEGELAKNALRSQRHALRMATLSLTVSFLAYALMQCFFTLSQISTDMTYFEKYQDAWDVMVTVKDTGIENLEMTDELRGLDGMRDFTIYQKASAKRMITAYELSEKAAALINLDSASSQTVACPDGEWIVNAQIVVLDDSSFLNYCRQIGAPPQLDGAIVLNRLWDSIGSNFRNREYVPYIKDDLETAVFFQWGNEEMAEAVAVIAYTEMVPPLREGYNEIDGRQDDFLLVHFLPLSLWKEIGDRIRGAEADTYIRVLAEEEVSLWELNELEADIVRLVGQGYMVESENRIQEKRDNDEMIQGAITILGGFCALLALIGIGNIFANTLGFVRQRRREFARYLSVGLTPEEMKKMFCVEALVIAGRPVVITLPITALMTCLMIRASYLDPMIFIRRMPVIPILLFVAALFGFVALAYYLGGRQMMKADLVSVLREDVM